MKRLPIAPPDSRPLPDAEKGRAIWKTRRLNQLTRAVAVLNTRRATYEERCFAAYEISDQVASGRREGVLLPRGYTVVRNKFDEPALSLDGELLGASVVDPLPSEGAIEKLTRDLATGWLSEVEGMREP